LSIACEAFVFLYSYPFSFLFDAVGAWQLGMDGAVCLSEFGGRALFMQSRFGTELLAGCSGVFEVVLQSATKIRNAWKKGGSCLMNVY